VGADASSPIPVKFGVRVASHDIIKCQIFVMKFSRVSDLQGRGSKFPLSVDFAGHRYNSVCDSGPAAVANNKQPYLYAL